MRGLLVVVGPFDRLRANGRERRAFGGEWGCDGVGDAPRGSPLDSCLRRNDARGGVRDGRDGEMAPRLAPALGSRESGNDGWGVWWDALARGVRVRAGARFRGRAVREPPLRPGCGARGRG